MEITSETDLSKLTVVILKKELESRELDTKGKKADLIERLSEVLKNDKVASPSKSAAAAAPSTPLKQSSPTTKSATAATASSPVKLTESSKPAKPSMTPASPAKTAKLTTLEHSSDSDIKTKAALVEKKTVPGTQAVEKKNASASKQPQSPLKVESNNVAEKKVTSPIKSSMQSQIASPIVKAASPTNTLKRTADEPLSPSKKARKAMDQDQGRDLDGVFT